jgi:acyl dehydratase
VLAFPLAVSLMVEPSFPFALPGLVHVANRITQKRALHANERLSLRVWASDLRDHPRGRQFDLLTEASVNGDPIWTESSTYLHRTAPSPARGGDSPSPAKSPSPLAGEGRGGGSPSSIWRIPRNVGRRYAAVSGDVNPIHLNPLAARLFGFRRAIAHGMWLKARCLAALEGRLPDAFTAEVEFKSPLFLPSTVGFASQPHSAGWTFAVAEARSGRPHLSGSIL